LNIQIIAVCIDNTCIMQFYQTPVFMPFEVEVKSVQDVARSTYLRLSDRKHVHVVKNCKNWFFILICQIIYWIIIDTSLLYESDLHFNVFIRCMTLTRPWLLHCTHFLRVILYSALYITLNVNKQVHSAFINVENETFNFLKYFF